MLRRLRVRLGLWLDRRERCWDNRCSRLWHCWDFRILSAVDDLWCRLLTGHQWLLTLCDWSIRIIRLCRSNCWCPALRGNVQWIGLHNGISSRSVRRCPIRRRRSPATGCCHASTVGCGHSRRCWLLPRGVACQLALALRLLVLFIAVHAETNHTSQQCNAANAAHHNANDGTV